MDKNKLEEKIKNIEEKLAKIEKITEQTRQYFLWFIILTVASVALPAIGLVFYIPKFISIYTQML